MKKTLGVLNTCHYWIQLRSIFLLLDFRYFLRIASCLQLNLIIYEII